MLYLQSYLVKVGHTPLYEDTYEQKTGNSQQLTGLRMDDQIGKKRNWCWCFDCSLIFYRPSVPLSRKFSVETISIPKSPSKETSADHDIPREEILFQRDPVKKIITRSQAMTWKVLRIVILNDTPYALFGSDAITNPYQGDTDTNAVLSLLGIKKSGLPPPSGLPSSHETPGGALRGSWSGGKVVIIPEVKGVTLTSQSIADELCRLQGLIILGEDGFRMAEFHDGDNEAGWAGWDFWADASSMKDLKIGDNRFWVSINDQRANPWQ